MTLNGLWLMDTTNGECVTLSDKQYTFRTTRSTEWIENVLDQIPRSSRSSIIRELIIAGLKVYGVEVDEESQKRSRITGLLHSIDPNGFVVRDSVPQQVREVLPNVRDFRDEVSQISEVSEVKVEDESDLFSCKEEDYSETLDKALDSLNFDNL